MANLLPAIATFPIPAVTADGVACVVVAPLPDGGMVVTEDGDMIVVPWGRLHTDPAVPMVAPHMGAAKAMADALHPARTLVKPTIVVPGG